MAFGEEKRRIPGRIEKRILSREIAVSPDFPAHFLIPLGSYRGLGVSVVSVLDIISVFLQQDPVIAGISLGSDSLYSRRLSILIARRLPRPRFCLKTPLAKENRRQEKVRDWPKVYL